MQFRPANLPRTTALSLAVIAAAFGAVGASLDSPERLVTSGLGDALVRSGSAASSGEARAASLAQISGSEEFWLSQTAPLAGTHPAAWTRPLAPGDRITLGALGRKRTLEIVSIERTGDALPSGARAGLLLVTCRDVGDTTAPLVKLWLESDGVHAPGTTAARTL